MSFTDLWRCRRCDTLPEVEFRGKNFLIRCKVCNSSKAESFAHSLGEVVKQWNELNDPLRVHPIEKARQWVLGFFRPPRAGE